MNRTAADPPPAATPSEDRSEALEPAAPPEVTDGPSSDSREAPGQQESDRISRRRREREQAQLTAASVADHDRRQDYLAYLRRHTSEGHRLRLELTRRLRLRVLDKRGNPVNDAAVSTRGIVLGRTHADGVLDLNPSDKAHDLSGEVELHVASTSGRARVRVDIPNTADAQETVIRLQGEAASNPQALDLAFLIDVTGSMEDELRYVNREVGRIVKDVSGAHPQLRIRVGSALYRDRTDQERLRVIPFSTDVARFASKLSQVHGSGGGDYPEDLNAGLSGALESLEWSKGNAVRVMVVIADAPPKNYQQASFTYQDAIRIAVNRGIRILPVAASGADRTVEYLFRAMASSTSTPYVYLTDDSGIGNAHLEADTERVSIEYFATLLTRLIKSDLAGKGMHEPDFQQS